MEGIQGTFWGAGNGLIYKMVLSYIIRHGLILYNKTWSYLIIIRWWIYGVHKFVKAPITVYLRWVIF